MLSIVLLATLGQIGSRVHVTVETAPSACDMAMSRLDLLEARIAAAGALLQQEAPRRTRLIEVPADYAPAPVPYPAPANGCYAPQAAAPSAYALPMAYQQRTAPQGYVTIDRRTDFGGQYASLERRGLLGQTRFAARSSPLGTQIERRGILGQRLKLSTSACPPGGYCP